MFQIIITFLIAFLPSCTSEDQNMCVWDANVQGNGQGVSFIAITDDLVIEF